jgi:probable DNA repair protein
MQLRAGRIIWPSIDVLTWEAWLTREWRAAVLRGAAPALQLLGAAQERELWQQVLQDMETAGVPLAPHASALARAAQRSVQSQLSLPRSAISEEERLLASALAGLLRRCEARGFLALKLAAPEALQFLRDVPPPAIVGEQRLTALQEALQATCWNGAPLLLPASSDASGRPAPRLLRLSSLEDELSACAQWCRRRLEADGAARLLVLTSCSQPSLPVQGELLWRELASGAGDREGMRGSMLAVEGGTPLHQVGLVADALLALGCMAAEVDTEALLEVLRSPGFDFGSQQELWSLQGRLEKWGMARWPLASLREALDGITAQEPAAARLRDWLHAMAMLADHGSTQSATEWARRFSDGLAAAGFQRARGLQSRDQQRLDRWSQLLDEFAGLDAVAAPMDTHDALGRLRQLAADSRHQPASGDAAITLSAALHDPVVHYDGIWVLGLAETRWPMPPRPDAYVSLQEQRLHHWAGSSVTERREQAEWALSRWRLRAGELVLSHPAMEGDLRHRPTPLLARAAEWEEGAADGATPVHGYSRPFTDQHFPAIPADSLVKPLTGGVERLRVQRDCEFRAQAQWRLKAMAPEPFSDGLTAPARGMLLHRLLEGVWGELRGQSQLLAMDPVAEAALLERQWNEALAGDVIPGARWWPRALRARERARTFAIMSEVLQLERARAPFTVQDRELKLQWPADGARLNLRIDRVDAASDGGRVLLDYKSGAAGRMKLHEGELEPLQLALYVAALAARGQSVVAAALFSLKPGEVGISGIATPGLALPGMKPLDDWQGAGAQWERELLQLLAAHLAGSGTLARDPAACRHCHLPALCRRVALEDADEGADD